MTPHFRFKAAFLGLLPLPCQHAFFNCYTDLQAVACIMMPANTTFALTMHLIRHSKVCMLSLRHSNCLRRQGCKSVRWPASAAMNATKHAASQCKLQQLARFVTAAIVESKSCLFHVPISALAIYENPNCRIGRRHWLLCATACSCIIRLMSGSYTKQKFVRRCDS